MGDLVADARSSTSPPFRLLRRGGHRDPFRTSDQLLVSWFPMLVHARPHSQSGIWVHQHQIPGGGRESGYCQPLLQAVVVANVAAGCKSGVVRSNKHVNKTTSSEDIQQ